MGMGLYDVKSPMDKALGMNSTAANTLAGMQQSSKTEYTKDGNKGKAFVSGAASGASVGTSILPGWGTAVGAVIGGILGMASS